MKKKVALDNSGDFTSIQAAIEAVPKDNQEEFVIEIEEGIYKEKLYIEKPFVTLKGKCAEKTIITYDDYARKSFKEGEAYGTFRSYTMFVGANDFKAENLTFENTAGDGRKVGQALAVYIDGDRMHFKACRFLACQDTIFTGPLPPAPIKIGSFKGPREEAQRINGRQYYEKCYIRGDIDFIFGSATAYFDECEIFSNNRDEKVNGYITAASTPEGQSYGYVFDKCRLTSDCKEETVYLGRPWRDYAHVVFLNCEMGAHIKKEGWHDWNKTKAQESMRVEEYNNHGTGSSLQNRAKWAIQLTEQQATAYTIEKVLGGLDGWNPRA